MARIFRKLAQLLDVDVVSTPPADGDSLTYDLASEKWVPEAVSGGGGGSDDQTAAEVPFTPAGNLSSDNVQDALEELDSEKAASSHVHAGEDITSGTVADARIASTIARDSEVTAAISALSSVYQAKDTTLDTYAGIDPSADVQSLLGAADYAAVRTLLSLVTGTDIPSLSTFDDHSARHEDGGADEISLAGLSGTSAALQSHLDDTADAHEASAISVADSAGNFTGTDVEAVLAELQDNIDAGGGGSSATGEEETITLAQELFA